MIMELRKEGYDGMIGEVTGDVCEGGKEEGMGGHTKLSTAIAGHLKQIV